MRSITTFSLTLALALTACTEDKNEPETTAATVTASATDGTGTDGTGSTGGTGTTAEETTTPTTSGGTESGTTAEPGTSTTTTTEPGTSTTTTEPGTSTTEPGTSTTDGTTGGGEDAWDPANCAMPSQPLMVGDIEGAFCSAPCKANADCPAGPGSTMALCILTVMDGEPPSFCALVCQVASDDCAPGSTCKDLMDPMNPGIGVCTYP